jgi:hypothetical protein
MRILCVIALVGLLSGCNLWPRHGEGGVAEYRAPAIWMSNEEEQLLNELQALQSETDQLVWDGAMDCQPAQVLSVQRAMIRVKRELYGDMLADAHDSMVSVKVALGRLHWSKKLRAECYEQRAQYYAHR